MANLIIKPTSGGSLILQDEGGTAAHTIDASGNSTLAGNATISGKSSDLKSTITKIKKTFDFKKFDSENISKSKFQPFHRLKVKIKKEVVPMGLLLSSKKKKDNNLDPNKWNKLIKNKDTLVSDSRKPFEYKVGTFKKSINPDVDTKSTSAFLISSLFISGSRLNEESKDIVSFAILPLGIANIIFEFIFILLFF